MSDMLQLVDRCATLKRDTVTSHRSLANLDDKLKHVGQRINLPE